MPLVLEASELPERGVNLGAEMLLFLVIFLLSLALEVSADTRWKCMLYIPESRLSLASICLISFLDFLGAYAGMVAAFVSDLTLFENKEAYTS